MASVEPNLAQPEGAQIPQDKENEGAALPIPPAEQPGASEGLLSTPACVRPTE